jgi:hypothetical protein
MRNTFSIIAIVGITIAVLAVIVGIIFLTVDFQKNTIQNEDSTLTIQENKPESNPSGNNNIEVVSLSASEIYEDSKDSMYIIETECDLKISYPAFDVNYNYDTYYDDLNIEINKLNTKKHIEDSVVWTGSGFLMNNKLYTNNHVIDCGTKEIQEELEWVYWTLVDYYNQGYYLDETYLEEIDYDINAKTEEIYDYFYNSNRYDYYFEEYVIKDLLVATIAEYLSENVEVSSTGRKIYAYHESDNFKSPKELILEDNGGNFPERDFSILNIESSEQNLDFEKNYQVKIGEEIFVIGFPSIEVDSPETEEEYYEWEIKKEPPIITKGIISSLKESRNGVKYYVIDAAANYGSSGGPVINNKGEVIGILTAGVEGLNFMLPLDEIDIGS